MKKAVVACVLLVCLAIVIISHIHAEYEQQKIAAQKAAQYAKANAQYEVAMAMLLITDDGERTPAIIADIYSGNEAFQLLKKNPGVLNWESHITILEGKLASDGRKVRFAMTTEYFVSLQKHTKKPPYFKSRWNDARVFIQLTNGMWVTIGIA